jgi:ABC-type phosphate transport system permease subunit
MGMLVATLLGIFLVPVLFVVIERLTHRGPSKVTEASPSLGANPVPTAGSHP